MLTANQIIDRLGGTVVVADALCLTASVVSSWRTAKGGIPRWWHASLIALPPKKGMKPIRQSDFPKREKVKRPVQPQSAAA